MLVKRIHYITPDLSEKSLFHLISQVELELSDIVCDGHLGVGSPTMHGRLPLILFKSDGSHKPLEEDMWIFISTSECGSRKYYKWFQDIPVFTVKELSEASVDAD